MRKKLIALACAALCLFALTGCKGKELPEGMEEQAVLSAGEELLQLLLDGDCQAVYDRLRADIRETAAVEDISKLLEDTLDGAGDYKKVSDTLVTGITTGKNPQGIAVFYCEYSKEDVMFRFGFDPDMEFIGLSMGQK